MFVCVSSNDLKIHYLAVGRFGRITGIIHSFLAFKIDYKSNVLIEIKDHILFNTCNTVLKSKEFSFACVRFLHHI